MRLLVSVRSAAEASAALAGGADVIDAKDPLTGSLGAVSLDVLRDIQSVVAGTRPVSAALGDAVHEADVERAARAFAASGPAFLKIGFSGIMSPKSVDLLVSAAVGGARDVSGGSCEVVVVAYADSDRAGSLTATALTSIAARAGAKGLLLDTWDKAGPGLCSLVTPGTLTRLVTTAHDSGLFVALAGKLRAEDVGFVRNAGADIAGVRGAACDGGRAGTIDVEKVRLLRTLCVNGESLSASAQPRNAECSVSL